MFGNSNHGKDDVCYIIKTEENKSPLIYDAPVLEHQRIKIFVICCECFSVICIDTSAVSAISQNCNISITSSHMVATICRTCYNNIEIKYGNLDTKIECSPNLTIACMKEWSTYQALCKLMSEQICIVGEEKYAEFIFVSSISSSLVSDDKIYTVNKSKEEFPVYSIVHYFRGGFL